MNPKHPIDDLFRRKLAARKEQLPMHVFEGITGKRRSQRSARDYRLGAMVMVILLASLLGGIGLNFEIEHHGQARMPSLLTPAVVPAQVDFLVSGKAKPFRSAQIPLFQGLPVSQNRVVSGYVQALPVKMAPVERGSSATADQVPLLQLASLPPAKGKVESMASPGTQTGLNMPKISCPTLIKRAGWAYSLRADSGPLLDHRQSTAFSYNAALSFQARAPNGITLESGLTYSRILEDLERYGSDDGRFIITTVYGPGGDMIDTDTIYEGAKAYIARNSYQVLDIPIMVGYAVHTGRWALGLQGGPAINLWLKPKATILFDISWTARMRIDYHLGQGWALGLSPNLTYYPNSFARDDFAVGQNYLLSGLSLGVQKRL